MPLFKIPIPAFPYRNGEEGFAQIGTTGRIGVSRSKQAGQIALIQTQSDKCRRRRNQTSEQRWSGRAKDHPVPCIYYYMKEFINFQYLIESIEYIGKFIEILHVSRVPQDATSAPRPHGQWICRRGDATSAKLNWIGRLLPHNQREVGRLPFRLFPVQQAADLAIRYLASPASSNTASVSEVQPRRTRPFCTRFSVSLRQTRLQSVCKQAWLVDEFARCRFLRGRPGHLQSELQTK